MIPMHLQHLLEADIGIPRIGSCYKLDLPLIRRRPIRAAPVDMLSYLLASEGRSTCWARVDACVDRVFSAWTPLQDLLER